MVETLFLELFGEGESQDLLHNTDYGFRIKLLQPKSKAYKLLYTDGLSSRAQPVKEGYEAFQKIELYFCLPAYWKIENEEWPLHWLNRLAELPQKNKTWYGPGDTIPAGNPPEQLSQTFEANHFMLAEPILLATELKSERAKQIETCFFAVIPILQPELDYKLRNSATVLTSRLIHKGHTEMVDTYRTSVCRKRFLGF